MAATLRHRCVGKFAVMEYESRQYIAIDLKSFFASVECVERGLDALDTCLVVADASRTEKTICLAVSSALKSYGIGGRPRLFEVVSKVKEVNYHRGHTSTSYSKAALDSSNGIAVDYIVAPPRMSKYIEYSARIYNIYLRYIAPEDIHVYSIDEVFIDATEYLRLYRTTAHGLAMSLIRAVLRETGITATAGIGTNLYLCKIAMDIMAKKMTPDKDGVRIAELDEETYRHELWTHTPLTDFWRVGIGTANRLALHGMLTMGDIARCSLENENLLYKLFGINAELLIDHAWGYEPVTMDFIKSYRPETKSLSSGQVLPEAYEVAQARNVILEMTDNMSLKLFEQRLVTDHITLTISYDRESLTDSVRRAKYHGRITTDHYGRPVPVHAQGSVALDSPTSSEHILSHHVAQLFDRIVNPDLLVRRMTLSVNRLIYESDWEQKQRLATSQLDLFTDYEAIRQREMTENRRLARERRKQEAVLYIKRRYGKNAILKGLNFSEGATQRTRNCQIGGHHE